MSAIITTIILMIQMAGTAVLTPNPDPVFGYAIVMSETVVEASTDPVKNGALISDASVLEEAYDPIFGYAVVLPEEVVTAPTNKGTENYVGQNQEASDHQPPLFVNHMISPIAYATPINQKIPFDCVKSVTGNFNVGPNDTIDDDVTLTGGNAKIDGVIDGDLAVMGGAVTINGKIDGDVAVFGGNLDINGTITGDAAVLGGNVNHQGMIENDLFVVGGTVALDSGSVVEGDVGLVGGDVDRDDNAIIKGDVKVIELGKLNKILPGVTRAFRFPGQLKNIGIFAGIFTLSVLIVVYIINLLIVLIFPKAMERIVDRIQNNVWISVAIGFGVQILFVPIIVLFAVSVIGIPLIPVFCLALIIAGLFGFSSISLIIGERIARSLNWSTRSMAGMFSIGWLAIMIIMILGLFLNKLGTFGSIVCILGSVIAYIALTIGAGGTIFALFKGEK